MKQSDFFKQLLMKSSIIVITLAVIFSSCKRMSEDELLQAAQNAHQHKNYRDAVMQFEELVDRFPQGKHTEASLLILATVYNDQFEDYRKTIGAYRRLRELFPQSEKAPMALFLIGFMYHNQLQQLDSAKTAYEQFLAQYPNHEMTASAKFELDHLGKKPDELIKPQVTEKTDKGKTAPLKRRKK